MWVRRQRPEDLLNVDIFFDGIGVHGARGLAEDLHGYAFEVGSPAVDFIKLLSEAARAKSPAFSLFGNFRKDERGRLDLKATGLFPLVTCARVLAIKYDIRERATPKRYRGLIEKNIGARSDVEGLIEAQSVIVGEMLAQQLSDIGAGTPPSTRVSVAGLDRARQAKLKEALKRTDVAVDLVGEGRM